MESTATGKGLASFFGPEMNTSSTVFSNIDNHPHRNQHRQQPKKPIQARPSKPTEDSKENCSSPRFIASHYDQLTVHRPFTNTGKPIKVVSQTFATSIHNERAEQTNERPTMGGKTIASVHCLSTEKAPSKANRMSSEELKSLSRRIDPHEVLASPHASPSKPPLPSIQRKRPLSSNDEEDKRSTKKSRLFICEPCRKVYKTKNGYIYHTEKCRLRIMAASKPIIECICTQPIDDSGTMIECNKCNKWLHVQCAGDINKEDDYCCPRCIKPAVENVAKVDTLPYTGLECHSEEKGAEEQHMFNNIQAIPLSVLSEANEQDDDLVKAFEEATQSEQQELEEDPDRNHLSFVSLFPDELTFDAGVDFNSSMTVQDSPSLPPSSIIADNEDWSNDFHDLNSSDWCGDDIPSLLFSDSNPPSSLIDDFAMSSDNQETDWLHLANFDLDFTSANI